MNRNKWIAVSAGILVIMFFLFGDTAISLFQQNAGTAATNTAVNTNTPPPAQQAPAPYTGGLQMQDAVVGTGATAVSGSLVTVHYVGTLTNGTKFDSSLDRGQPFQFRLGAGQVIKGWDQGVAGMKVGGKRLLLIPSDLAYGAQQVGPIPANSALIFEVELLKVEK
jgi:peptidylprolyl isomerase